MTDRLKAAQAALNAGRRDEAIEHMVAAVAEEAAQAASVYRVLSVELYRAGRFEEGEAFAAKGLARYPRDHDLLNTRGILLRRMGRPVEAVPVLEQALKTDPRSASAQQNLGNVLMDIGDAARAEAVFAKLARAAPRNAEYQRLLGRALAKQGKVEPALMRLRQAVAIKRDAIEAWLDLSGQLAEAHRHTEAVEAIDKALALNPGHIRLIEGKVVLLRRLGETGKAEAVLNDVVAANPNTAWARYQLGLSIADRDRLRANEQLAEACRLDPAKLDYAVAYVESLERTRAGDEGANVEQAYQLGRKLLARRAEFNDAAAKIMNDVLGRVCDHDALDQLGDFVTLGRSWARNGRHAALFKQLSRVRSNEDRLELVEQHRTWGRLVDATVKRRDIKRPPPRAADGKIRVGFMSSDLRQHPVGYFSLPLFDHFDRDRFEVYAYSFFQGPEDAAQKYITKKITAFRWWPEISTLAAAEAIAADQLDMLIELGGSTHMNKLEVMAYKPAPVQASWLGYPHSAGLESIDYFVCDPYIVPDDAALLIERPMMLKNAWYPLSRQFFRDEPAADSEPPVARNGYVTFGTANQPHKYTREVLDAWARVLAAVPSSRFLFIRPEGGSESFRENIRRAFARHGVGGERIEFEAVRGVHLPHYNRMDISLDTFPQTGGTTTCESMWMGAPCISLVGPAPYERLSYSVLKNVGLPELCAWTVDEYIAAAIALGSDPQRIADLRAGLRARMRNSPLGQEQAWAADFYEAVEKAVAAARIAQPAG